MLGMVDVLPESATVFELELRIQRFMAQPSVSGSLLPAPSAYLDTWGRCHFLGAEDFLRSGDSFRGGYPGPHP